MNEKREVTRYTTQQPVFLVVGTEKIEALMVDVSTGGIKVAAKTKLRLMERLRILIDNDDVEAQVVNIKRQGFFKPLYWLGLQFLKPRPELVHKVVMSSPGSRAALS
jgi:hypothetical protein